MSDAATRPEETGGEEKTIVPDMRLYLKKDTRFFGPGLYDLLCLIEETGSLRAACESMGISYSKSWKRIVIMETQMGKTIVQRSRGGAARGQSHLTEDGKKLVQSYEAVLRDCEQVMEESFTRHFGKDAAE